MGAAAYCLAAGCYSFDEDVHPVAYEVLTTCVKVEQPTEAVFRSSEEVLTFWSRHQARTPPPEVDFGRSMLAAHFDGAGSACTGFTVEDVRRDDGRVVVSAVRRASTDPCIAVIAYPQLVLRVEATGLPVLFSIRSMNAPPPPRHEPCI